MKAQLDIKKAVIYSLFAALFLGALIEVEFTADCCISPAKML